jgi:hypothetical protein
MAATKILLARFQLLTSRPTVAADLGGLCLMRIGLGNRTPLALSEPLAFCSNPKGGALNYQWNFKANCITRAPTPNMLCSFPPPAPPP